MSYYQLWGLGRLNVVKGVHRTYEIVTLGRSRHMIGLETLPVGIHLNRSSSVTKVSNKALHSEQFHTTECSEIVKILPRLLLSHFRQLENSPGTPTHVDSFPHRYAVLNMPELSIPT
jgi:hypothetical protein